MIIRPRIRTVPPSCLRFLILLWKNLLLRKCHFIITVMEILLPGTYVIALYIGNTHISLGQHEYRPGANPHRIPREDYEFSALISFTKNVAYAPSSPFIEKVIERMKVLNTGMNPTAFNSEKAIEERIKWQFSPPRGIDAAIIFGEGFKTLIGSIPPDKLNLDYKIRIVQDSDTFPIDTNKIHPGRVSHDMFDACKRYKDHNFVGLQILLDRAIIDVLTGIPDNYPPDVHALSFPASIIPDKPSTLDAVFMIYPMVIGLGYLILLPAVLVETVGERATGVKELTRVMGLPNWMHLGGWVLNFAITSVLSVSIIVYVLFRSHEPNGPLIINASKVMFWMLLFLYCLQTVAICLLLAAIFERVFYPLTITMTVSVLTTFSCFPLINIYYTKMGLALQLLLCTVPNGALSMSAFVMGHITSRNEATFFRDLQRGARLYPGDTLSIGLILAVMLSTTVICLLLSLYLENVLPSTYGARKRWYYIFKKDTWWASRRPPTLVDTQSSVQDMTKEDSFEAEPSNAEIGIEIKNLRKLYSGKVAVDDVSLNILKGQITVLLGQSGSGKSTLMAMLTGLTSPTSGTAIVNGCDISTGLSGARDTLGLCPQQNMLFNNLTVNQHLIFFAMLKGKGVDFMDLKPEIRQLLKKVNLYDKKDEIPTRLSEGQRRKLTLCMALVGESTTVILDEPTSGMDPAARRGVWDLLSEARTTRTILMTSYQMDEADVLGDRVAIMEQGKLTSCGSPRFFKNRAGIGYILRVSLSRPTPAAEVLAAVQQNAPEAALKPSHSPKEIVIALPTMKDSFTVPPLLSAIEARKDELSITSVDITYASMEDIFGSFSAEDPEQVSTDTAPATPKMSGLSVDMERSSGVADPKDPKEIGSADLSNTKVQVGSPLDSEHSRPASLSSLSKRNSQRASTEILAADENNLKARKAKGAVGKRKGCSLFCQQFTAMVLKRVWFTWGNKTALIFQVVMPLLVLIAVILIGNRVHFQLEPPLPPLLISLKSYSNPVVRFDTTTAGRVFATAYASVVGRTAKEVGAGEEVTFIVDRAQNINLMTFRSSYVVAASFKDNKTIAMFSAIPFHTLPLTVNLVDNAWLKAVLPGKSIRIQVTAHPLQAGIPAAAAPLGGDYETKLKQLWVKYPLLFAPIFAVGFAAFTATFVMFPVEERITKVKHLQLMTGISPLTFWAASFLVDFGLVLILTLLLLASLPIVQIHSAFTAYHAPGVLALILMSTGFASISFAYAVSLFVSSPNTGFIFVAFTDIFYGTFLAVVFNITIVTTLYPPPHGSPAPWYLYYVPFVGRIFPFYGFVAMCMSFAITMRFNNHCNALTDSDRQILCQGNGANILKACCNPCTGYKFSQLCFPYLNYACFDPEPFLKWWSLAKDEQGLPNTPTPCNGRPGIVQDLVFELLLGLIYMGIVLFVDFRVVRRIQLLFRRSKNDCSAKKVVNLENDTGAVEEGFKVQAGIQKGPTDDAIVVCNVRKLYGGFVVVSNLSYGIRRGECFGLVGMNAAGTSTAFSVLTGALVPSRGNAFISPCVVVDTGYGSGDLYKAPTAFWKSMGYCPQEDSIIGALTGMELLKLFSRLRGASDVSGEARKWLEKFGLSGSEKLQSKNYSRGMKRRLCAAMAMIGDPPIILMEEPTSSVDPMTRRQLWGVLKSAQKSDQTIILKTHNVAESEFLCSRLGIMLHGELQCLGSPGEIKDKYGQGFFLLSIHLTKTVTSSPETDEPDGKREELKEAISTRFAPCEIVDERENMIHYHVSNMELSWAERFEIAEDLKQSHSELVQDYSLTEANLEDVFLSFTRMQNSKKNA